MNQEVYTIGKIKVVKQAYIVLVSGLIGCGLLFLIALFAFNNIKVKAVLGLVSIILFGLVCYQAYIVNCAIVGNCNKLAWIISILFVFIIIAYAIQLYKTFKFIDIIVSERKQSLAKIGSKSKKLSKRSSRK